MFTRKSIFTLFGFVFASAVVAYIVFMSYLLLVAREQTRVFGEETTQEHFQRLVIYEIEYLKKNHQFFWPAWPKADQVTTPAPVLTPTPIPTSTRISPTPTPLPTASPTIEPTPLGYTYEITFWTQGYQTEITLWSTDNCDKTNCQLKVVRLITDSPYTEWIDVIDHDQKIIYRLNIGTTTFPGDQNWYFDSYYQFDWIKSPEVSYPTYTFIRP